MKNPELAHKIQPILTIITVLGILGLCYCGYMMFFIADNPSDTSNMVYAIYGLLIAITVAPLAEINMLIDERTQEALCA